MSQTVKPQKIMSSRSERSKDKLTARDQLESVRPLSRLSLTMQRDSLAPSVESPHRRVCKLRNRERFPFDAQRERADANAGGDNDSLADAQAVTQEPLLLRKHARLGEQMRGWVHFHISPEKDALQSALGSAPSSPPSEEGAVRLIPECGESGAVVSGR